MIKNIDYINFIDFVDYIDFANFINLKSTKTTKSTVYSHDFSILLYFKDKTSESRGTVQICIVSIEPMSQPASCPHQMCAGSVKG